MPKITVGVPTYNGERFLEESLQSLMAQDHPDYRVIILDNASTDRTAEIAQDVCRSDPRFIYRRNPQTVIATENFRTVWSMADSPYFLWRADDDLSAPNYLSALDAALEAQPEAWLAVGNLDEKFEDRTRFFKAPDFGTSSRHEIAAKAVRMARPYWLYGMWRNHGALAPIWETQKQYGWLWAWDHLAMLPTLMAGRVTFTGSTTFTQRILRHDYYLLDPFEKLKARERYKVLAHKLLAANEFQSPDMELALEGHIEDRVARLWSTRRMCVRDTITLRRWRRKRRAR